MVAQKPFPFGSCLVSDCFLLHSMASVGRDRLGFTHFGHSQCCGAPKKWPVSGTTALDLSKS